ncbi:MAG: PepSY domain-containing protein [Chloroflexales bacterium]|nr:PepSY domain-containing protein [Chloroflexales bacterium]
MTQRTTLIIAAALTAFVLVLIGGLATRLAQTTPNTGPESITLIEPTAIPTATTGFDPTVQTLIEEREAAYQQALQQANDQLQQSYQDQQALRDQLIQSQSNPQPNTQAAPAPAQPAASSGASSGSAPAYPVSLDQAKQIALDTVPGATLTRDPELVNFQSTVAYEVALDKGNVYIDANSGQVLYNGAAPPPAPASAFTPAQPITQEQAVQTASAYLGGGTVVEVERENEHGVDVYEVKFADGSEIYVDAVAGQVVYAQLKGDGDNDERDGYEDERDEREDERDERDQREDDEREDEDEDED